MKKIVYCSILAISFSFSNLTWSQDFAKELLGNQGAGPSGGVQPASPAEGLRGVIREQLQNAIQPIPLGGQNNSPNVQAQGGSQVNGQVGGSTIQGGTQLGGNVARPQQNIANPLGAGTSVGSQLLGVLRANLNDHAVVGQDGSVRFRNDLNPQLRDLGILPNDQLIDANGQSIQGLNAANTYLQANQNLRVKRNGQIVTLQQSMPQSSSNANQIGWSFGTRNNGVYITSLVANSMAAQAGLRAGDQIVSINGNPVRRSEDISTYMLQPNNSTATVVYVRDGQSAEAIFQPSSQDNRARIAPQSVQGKLDQIERLLGEIRAELALPR